MQAVTRVNAEQTSKRTMRRPTRPPYRGRLIRGLLAELRLLANNHVPTYHVVVGDVIGADKVAAAFDKLGSVEVEAVSQAQKLGNELKHWLPTCWPLPFWRR